MHYKRDAAPDKRKVPITGIIVPVTVANTIYSSEISKDIALIGSAEIISQNRSTAACKHTFSFRFKRRNGGIDKEKPERVDRVLAAVP